MIKYYSLLLFVILIGCTNFKNITVKTEEIIINNEGIKINKFHILDRNSPIIYKQNNKYLVVLTSNKRFDLTPQLDDSLKLYNYKSKKAIVWKNDSLISNTTFLSKSDDIIYQVHFVKQMSEKELKEFAYNYSYYSIWLFQGYIKYDFPKRIKKVKTYFCPKSKYILSKIAESATNHQ